jgi:hypothetical protein
VWARLCVATGLRRDEFEEMELADVAALNHAVAEEERREMRRDARLFALMCNLTAGGRKGGKTWSEEDFLPKETAGPIDDEKAREALEAYRARVAKGRKRRG